MILALDGMDRVLEVDELERIAVVQPGAVNDDLRAHVATLGLWYPPDPASSPWSTIGGNVATNAYGVCCLKYGVTRDYVLGLEVVTGTGEVVRLGRRTSKESLTTTLWASWWAPRARLASSPRSRSGCDDCPRSA